MFNPEKRRKFFKPVGSPDPRVCIDDRMHTGKHGVHLPGIITSLVDAAKRLLDLNEQRAWRKISRAGIPLIAHPDCYYNKMVETNPAVVLAPDAVPAQDRLQRLLDMGGSLITHLDKHSPRGAIINHVPGVSLDTNAAVRHGVGMFSLDKWAAGLLARKLGVHDRMHQRQFAQHLEEVTRRTVKSASGIDRFYHHR